VPFELYPYYKQPLPLKIKPLAVWGAWKILCTKIQKFFTKVHMHTPKHFLFLKKWSKSVQNKWPKGRVACMTEKKHILAPLRELLGQFPPFLRATA